jgi:hypothetical protein
LITYKPALLTVPIPGNYKEKNLAKVKIIFFVVLTMIIFQPFCFAGTGITIGSVKYFRTHDPTVYPTWAPPRFWFQLSGVSSAGACQTWHGDVLFVAETKEELAMIMSAYSTTGLIGVAWDDTTLQNGWCKALYLTAGDPPPLY